jgi:tricorn protease-like protein
MAQNPFRTEGDVIIDFNISPNGKKMVYKERTADGAINIKIKELKTGKVSSVISMKLKWSDMKEIYSGVDFLTNNEIIYVKGENMVSFNLKNKKRRDLAQLTDILGYIKALDNGKGVYFTDDLTLYYSSTKEGSVSEINKIGLGVLSMSVDKDNRLLYTIGKQVFCLDKAGNEVKEITSEIAKLVVNPYLIEATDSKNSFIVAGKEGIFKVDISKGQSIKLTDNEKENPVTKIRLTPNGKTLYYQRNLDYNKISALEL